jgi:hypothetical protein
MFEDIDKGQSNIELFILHFLAHITNSMAEPTKNKLEEEKQELPLKNNDNTQNNRHVHFCCKRLG